MSHNEAFLVAAEVCKRFEGFHRRHGDGMAVPYICPAGYWTIGYGHLCSRNHLPIHRGQAEVLLHRDLAVAMAQVIKLSPTLLEVSRDRPGRLAALTSFVFNLGAGRYRGSTLRRRVNEGNWDDVPRQLRRWVYSGGKKLKGLVIRREAEAVLI